jgi:hypothetical protein
MYGALSAYAAALSRRSFSSPVTFRPDACEVNLNRLKKVKNISRPHEIK